MEQKDAFLLLILFAAAEDRNLRDTLSSALAFYRDNRDMLSLLFAPERAQKRDGAETPPAKGDEAASPREEAPADEELSLDPAVVSALFRLRKRG